MKVPPLENLFLVHYINLRNTVGVHCKPDANISKTC